MHLRSYSFIYYWSRALLRWLNFDQNALNALMEEGSDGEEWGGLRHYAMMEILGGEDTNDDIDSASSSCSSTTSRDHEELPGVQPRTRAFCDLLDTTVDISSLFLEFIPSQLSCTIDNHGVRYAVAAE